MRWLLIDKIIECEPGVSAVGVKTFPSSEIIFKDHFPGFPIVPGVLQIEMMAQMAGKCAALSLPGVLPVLGTVKNAKFYRNINPDEQATIIAKITKIAKAYITADAEVHVDGKKAASATILFGMVDRKKLNSNEFDAVSQDWLNRQNAKAKGV